MPSNAQRQPVAHDAVEKLRQSLLSLDIPTRQELATLTSGSTDRAQFNALRSFAVAVQAVTTLPAFKAMKAAAQAKKHCLRCHGPYTEAENSSDACRIPHVFDSEPGFTGKVLGYDKVYEYQAKCCEDVVVEEEGAGNGCWLDLDRLEPCYEGYHTDDPEDVEEDYNDASIVPCKLDANGKCTEEWRDYCDEDDTVFN